MTLAYSELSQISKIESFTKMVNCFLSKPSILDVRQGFELAYGRQIETLLIKQMCFIEKAECFYSFTNNSNPKHI